MSGILRIANLCKSYSITNTERQDVLKGINIELEAGEFVALLGESGCGKSTLLHILGGMDTDYTGSVVVKGKFIRDFSEKEMDDYRKRGIGMIFQNYNLISHMTLLENVEIALKLSDIDKETRKNRALDLLNIVGLKEQAEKLPSQLSGGQKQRVAIARALANNPSIILADEPTGALDKESTEDIINILKRISKMGKLVLVVTHSEQVAQECSRILTMDDGLIIHDEIKEKPTKNKYEKYKETETKNITLKSIFMLGLKNVLGNLKRNLFVALGISIGITALILILCLSEGITNYVTDYYAQDEMSTIIMVEDSTSFTSKEISEIEATYGVSKVYKSYKTTKATFNYNELSGSMGTIYSYHDTTIFPEILYGKDSMSSSEIIINLTLAEKLSSEGIIGSLGNVISITYQEQTMDFTIVGLYDDASDISTSYISLSDMTSLSSISNYNVLYVKAKDITYLESVVDSMKSLGYTTTTYDDSSSTLLNYIDLGTNVLIAVALIATIVSAIMIIIVQYISVLERTQEIGILRSIGGRKKDISRIFMTEASYLGLAGGIFGIGTSLLLMILINVITKITMNYFFVSFNFWYYLLGLGIAILVSIFAGIAPSRKAAGLDPVEALRFE